MGKTNTEIVRGFIEAINNNQFERVYDFCTEDPLAHVPPYVGLGIMLDDSDGQHVIVMDTARGGPPTESCFTAMSSSRSRMASVFGIPSTA